MKKYIKDYENYEIFDDGTVVNLDTNKVLAGSIGENGYKYYRLSKNGNKKMFYAHRLVAEAFLENDNNLPVVNHIDGNKHNNNLSNLRLITLSENVKEAYYSQKINSNIKPINQYDLKNNLIATFPSSREAGRQLNLDSSSIIKCCKGKLKTTGGFIFHYA